MHTIVVFTRRSRHEGVLGAWLADAVERGETVLVLRAPGEDASVLNRTLAAAGLDPSGVVGSGQVEMLDSARWRAESGGRAQRHHMPLALEQLDKRTQCGGLASARATREHAHLMGGRHLHGGAWGPDVALNALHRIGVPTFLCMAPGAPGRWQG